MASQEIASLGGLAISLFLWCERKDKSFLFITPTEKQSFLVAWESTCGHTKGHWAPSKWAISLWKPSGCNLISGLFGFDNVASEGTLPAAQQAQPVGRTALSIAVWVSRGTKSLRGIVKGSALDQGVRRGSAPPARSPQLSRPASGRGRAAWVRCRCR